MLFLFYIDDIFKFLGRIYDGGRDILDVLHLLIHADDATVLARDRAGAIRKLRTMLEYCNMNHIIPQYTKCEFIVVNGNEEDRLPLPFGDKKLESVDHFVLLGSHLTSSASVKDEMKLHMDLRYKSVIKFYNFIRSNKMAPLTVKLKALKSCVISSLLYNCETFGNYVPKDLESTYKKMLKCCFNVRLNVSNDILYIESDFLPIKAIILIRQYKFYKRFRESIKSGSRREKMLNILQDQETNFIQHYENLVSKYSCVDDIVNEYKNEIKSKIRRLADNDHYKYKAYLENNPDLSSSPFLDIIHPTARDIIKFRLGSHYLRIETGRWNGTRREERLCSTCGVLGDERHILYCCSIIDRNGVNLDGRLSHIWYQPDIYTLFKQIKIKNFI